VQEKTKPVRIGIFGHVGNQNLGDEATFSAVISNIRARIPTAELCAFTLWPGDTQRRHGIPAYAIRRLPPDPRQGPHLVSSGTSAERHTGARDRIKNWLQKLPVFFNVLRGCVHGLRDFGQSLGEPKFLWESRKHLKGVGQLIIAGSQQLSDYHGGPWGFPFTMFKWTLLAQTTGSKVLIVSVGAGPVDTWLGRQFLRYVVNRSIYCSYRDAHSLEVLAALRIKAKGTIVPDLVYSLVAPATESQATATKIVVGINALPYFDDNYWPEHDPEIYHAYLKKVATFARWLVRRGYLVVLFPTQLRADPPVIARLKSLMASNGIETGLQGILDPPVSSFNDLLTQIAEADYVVTTRFHALILSYVMGKPVLGIAYHKKTQDIMRQMGQQEFALDIRSFTVEQLCERFESLENAREASIGGIRERLTANRHALDRQYDLICQLANSSHAGQS
jgi:polysaccharide pyruvyl transferase WcaK-like protein